MSLSEVKCLNIPKIPDERGNLSFFQNHQQISFEIQRLYWINDIPGGTVMDGYANTESQEVVIALSGSFDVLVHDGKEEKKFTLSRPDNCLYIPKMTWRQLLNFSTNSVAFVLADKFHDGSTSITDFSQFQLQMMRYGGFQ
jgi:hypothetical protein